ncbi:elongation factor G [Striga asiatica]|uniref:Elongation factor G n=1 Tax=Striga asiatica TaxID=4170 RepID=A0A5A7PX96_STRAF|nr:elongation factor G [Striga asiatica]
MQFLSRLMRGSPSQKDLAWKGAVYSDQQAFKYPSWSHCITEGRVATSLLVDHRSPVPFVVPPPHRLSHAFAARLSPIVAASPCLSPLAVPAPRRRWCFLNFADKS